MLLTSVGTGIEIEKLLLVKVAIVDPLLPVILTIVEVTFTPLMTILNPKFRDALLNGLTIVSVFGTFVVGVTSSK